MSISEQDVMEDLAFEDSADAMDMAEGESDFFSGESEDSFAEDDFDSAEDYGEDSGEDDFEAEEGDEFIGQLLGGILGAEDEDEFLGKLFSGAKNLIKKAAPFVGKIARGAAPILSMIPHPAAQAVGQVANVLGKLRAEGASVEDSLEAVAEVAARDPRALPLVAGLAARTVLRNRAASMPAAQRQQVAKAMTRAARTLVASGGPRAIRALPKIARSVRRTAASRGTPAALQPKVVARTAAKVAQSPQLLRRLSAPSRRAQSLVGRGNGGNGGSAVGGWGGHRGYGGGGYGGSRTINVPGPATITITVG